MRLPLRVYLVLGGVADESLGVREGDVARGRPVTLVVRDNLNLQINGV